MRLAIVNSFYPPDRAITGLSAHSLARRMRDTIPGLEVRVFATNGVYRKAARTGAGVAGVERICSSYRGSIALLRLGASLWDGIRLARRACRYGDVVIAMTDPPLLGLWVGIESRRRNRLWIEWTMDLYPEAFASAGLCSSRGLVYRLLVKAIRNWAPARYISLGRLQHRWLQTQRAIERPAFILPCGIVEADAGDAPAWRTDGKVVLAYAGNVGQAHSAEVIAEIARRANPEKFAFVLAAQGPKAPRLKELTRGLCHVTWCRQLSHSDLAHADVHIVSLTRDWSHVCVPSKAVSAVCLGRPILFAGSPDTDTWNQMGSAGWLVPEKEPGEYDSADVDRALGLIGDSRALREKTEEAVALGAIFKRCEQEEYARIVAWLGAQANRTDAGATALTLKARLERPFSLALAELSHRADGRQHRGVK